MWNTNTVEDEIQRNSLEYGVSVNTDRSIPDAKSGLKPVARRIIYDAFVEGRTSDKPHVKSARICGDTMGRFHPHGDSSIYGAMIRLSQNWVMRYPLIDVHGNNGTILGDGPAAARYTEARLAKISEDGLLQGIKKSNIDFVPNYDESEEEPVTLPAIFPNLLCNPNEGIGWAMGCSWAPHNLREVKDAIFSVLDGNEPELPGPDFPTGGIVINKNDIPNIMATGRGTVKVRGRYKIEKNKIIFYEIPYGTRVESLMEEIGAACDDESIEGVEEVRNETGKQTGLRLTIEVERGVNPEVVVSQLFAKTNLESQFSYNQVALVGKTPVEMNLKQAIDIYIKHNLECIVREFNYDKNKATARLEIVNGLINALGNIDDIIATIKASPSAADAKTALTAKYSFTANQVAAIVDMKLGRLAHLEQAALTTEEGELKNKIIICDNIISSEKEQKNELRHRLESFVNKYGDNRRTEIIQLSVSAAAPAAADPVVVTATEKDIKKVDMKNVKVQKKGGKGVKTKQDAPIASVSTSTTDTLMIFTNKGLMYKLAVNVIPDKSTVFNKLLKWDVNQRLVAMTAISSFNRPKHIGFLTKNGLFKKSDIDEYANIKKNTGVSVMKLKDDDEIADICLFNEEDIIATTSNGYCLRFETKDIASFGRAAGGIKCLKPSEGTFAKQCLPVKGKYVITITQHGYGKKTPVQDFPIQGRGGRGVKMHNQTRNTGLCIGAVVVDESDQSVFISGVPASICVKICDIPEQSRITMGNILIKGSTVSEIIKIEA